jgi:hypothetical protein
VQPGPFSPPPAADCKKAEYPDFNFRLCGPTVTGKARALFNEGLLYRIEAQANSAWYFYNDCNTLQMNVGYVFGPESQLRFGPTVTSKRNAAGEFEADMVVYPGQTLLFCKGVVNGFRSRVSTDALSAEYASSEAEGAAHAIATELERMRAVPELADVSKLSDDEIVALCVKHQVPFVDTRFFPGADSLMRDVDPEQVEPLSWERPASYLPAELAAKQVVGVNVHPADIDQGLLGDCYLLCSLAAVAERPKELREMFRAGDPHQLMRERGVGAFRVLLNKHGWWKNVIVDSYLPVKGATPAFARTEENPAELWVSLAEKAFAKVHGSYSTIIGGDALRALTDLTGYPSMAWPNFKTGSTVFKRMLDSRKEGYHMSVFTPDASSPQLAKYDPSKFGLALGHAYTVLDVKEFPKDGLELVQIRNPWGSAEGEWTGDFGDASPIWAKYPEAAAACPHGGADGEFWMKWEDVQHYFEGGGVCFTETTFNDYRIRGSVAPKTGASVACEIKVTGEPAWFCVTLSQKDRRCAPDPEQAPKYLPAMLSMWAPGAGQRPNTYGNIASTSGDAENPSGPNNYTMMIARDIGMYMRLDPRPEPYILVPAFDMTKVTGPTQYVLGFQTERRVGGDIEVNFTHVPLDHGMVKLQYSAAYTSAPVECDYQCNPDFGKVFEGRGTKLEHLLEHRMRHHPFGEGGHKPVAAAQ